MCLGVPGQIETIIDAGNGLAWVSLSGVRREVNISCVQTDADATALIGQWVIVHAGFALELLDEAEALRTLDLLRALEQSQAGIPS